MLNLYVLCFKQAKNLVALGLTAAVSLLDDGVPCANAGALNMVAAITTTTARTKQMRFKRYLLFSGGEGKGANPLPLNPWRLKCISHGK